MALCGCGDRRYPFSCGSGLDAIRRGRGRGKRVVREGRVEDFAGDRRVPLSELAVRSRGDSETLKGVEGSLWRFIA